MGVQGLWKLLNPTSRQVNLNGLEGKVLAVDISIWLHQATKGVRNSNSPNAHILVLYNRICKLLYAKIKPIFIFDGLNVPILKRKTLENRRKKRNDAERNVKNIEEKIQENLLKEYLLRSCSQSDANNDNKKSRTLKNEKETLLKLKKSLSDRNGKVNIDNLFILPEIKTTLVDMNEDTQILTNYTNNNKEYEDQYSKVI
jgi:DNA excision repair protein ERCC-5